jgi:glutathione S-transferase
MVRKRFLANRFGLVGSNEFEKAEIDMYADLSLDMFTGFTKIYFEKDEVKKAELREKYLSESIPNALKLFEAKLSKTNTGFLVGNKVSWADVYLHNIVDNLDFPIFKKKDAILANFPLVKKHYEAFRIIPSVAKYLAKRPESEH